MTKTYELPDGRRIIEEFDDYGIGKITVQALDSLVGELKKCENCKILELLVDLELETICEDDDKDFEYCENNCDFKAPTKECYLHWAEHKRKEKKQ